MAHREALSLSLSLYFAAISDWHDTILGGPTIRYRPTVFTGKVMIHCHILEHEDEGMMAMEYIHPANDTDGQFCTCGESSSSPLKLASFTSWTFEVMVLVSLSSTLIW